MDPADTTPPLVRPAVTADDRGLAELDASAWPVELQVVPPRPADAPFFAGGRAVDDVWVAEDHGVVVGYAHLVRHLPVPSNAHVLHLNALVVGPAARGRGTGAALLGAAVTEARRRGARKLGLRALSINAPALALYQRAGFIEEGRLREEFRLPDARWVDDVWMALRLDEA